MFTVTNNFIQAALAIEGLNGKQVFDDSPPLKVVLFFY
jgi:hypothetical protein